MHHDLKFNLAETFVSIQGEGRYLGQPSFFLRTSGCNLRCEWSGTRCDTPHTSWEAVQQPVTVAEAVARIAAYQTRYPLVRHLVLTGGEPLLQGALPQLVSALKERNLLLTLETNGTIFKELAVDFVSLSPKLSSSTPSEGRWKELHDRTRIQLDCLSKWLERYPCQLKFVVNDAADEEEIVSLLKSLPMDVPPEWIYLMPQGIDAEQCARHGKICVEICLRRGWHFTPRAHIEIYGNEPGT